MLEKIIKDNQTLKIMVFCTLTICMSLAIVTGHRASMIENLNAKLDTMEKRHIKLLKKMGIYDKSEYMLIMR